MWLSKLNTMRNILIVYIFIISCDLTMKLPDINNKIIPDNTPFITGIIEASNDSTFYYPQITVGYVSDADFSNEIRLLKNIPGLFSPTQLIQIYKTVRGFNLNYHYENEAQVIIKGPLGQENEKKILLDNEDFGVYGDTKSDLMLLPGHYYELYVKLTDGRVFTSKTHIPSNVSFSIPDSIGLEVRLTHFGDGTPKEESYKNFYTYFHIPNDSRLFEIQVNTNNDKYILLLESDVVLPFSDRSDYHRIGSYYGIFSNEVSLDSLRTFWLKDIDQYYIYQNAFQIESHRYGFYSDGMWDNFQILDRNFTASGQTWNKISDDAKSALLTRDSTYLKRVSTIDEIGPDGEILPKDEANVIGFFAGSFSVYKKTVVYPIRNFDLDSVLTAHGVNND